MYMHYSFLHNPVTFFCSDHSLGNRQCVDRRRLEEAHLRYCILDVYKRYPAAFPHGLISTNLQQTLDDITPTYYEAFTQKYAG